MSINTSNNIRNIGNRENNVRHHSTDIKQHQRYRNYAESGMEMDFSVFSSNYNFEFLLHT